MEAKNPPVSVPPPHYGKYHNSVKFLAILIPIPIYGLDKTFLFH